MVAEVQIAGLDKDNPRSKNDDITLVIMRFPNETQLAQIRLRELGLELGDPVVVQEGRGEGWQVLGYDKPKKQVIVGRDLKDQKDRSEVSRISLDEFSKLNQQSISS